jgi:thiol-disulfide isomerase/thioredoxin
MLKKSLLFTALTLFTLFQGCSDSSNGETESLIASNEFELTDLGSNPYTVVKEGKNLTLKGHENKVVIYDIFATWCQPCRAEAPHLANLQKKFPDDLVVMGVTIEEGISNAKLQEFKRENNADFIIVNSEVNRPFYRSIASSINIGQQFPIPLMVMYKNGQYVTHYVGMVAEEMIESDIKMALGRK